ncbi:argininosuccinate lyase [Natranaerovirga pectinivora]|uniref:Argininosuccinate lyase n=1 Tax=Natranaerovirga pectinivora TaxID=682400 RepID=A0A4R3MMY4_9FIRM|nr:argininosuccinate lyase [Natranaerovirga pectinivora]TCT16345.1 argininosuccinate lyase [Natranaerovirga pectinivora]
MKLWGGRFTKKTDSMVHEFNTSINFDQRLYAYDIKGSIAHVTMLAKQDIIGKDDAALIEKGLLEILDDINNHKLDIDPSFEDIHSFIESTLIDRIGDTGKKLHTGRSRNDQVILDMKLYTKDEIKEIDGLLKNLLEVLLKVSKNNTKTIMPGFTHLQKAQPITLAHHFMAYFEMFKRDRSRLADIFDRMNELPLGSGALAGTTFPIDREFVAEMLDFKGVTLNSMDSVSDRDFLVELLNALSLIMMHLSRFCEEIIIWSSDDYRYVELDDAYSTGSSIMPQKKNPDIAELIRGKTGRVYGSLMSLLTTLKGLPLAYNKDMQEDKELVFDAIDTVKTSLVLFAPMIDTMKFLKENMYKSCQNGFTNATDVADYLVVKSIPFRDAHHIVGQLVLYCIEQSKSLDDLTLDEYKAIDPIFEEDIFHAIALETCVERRASIGGPAEAAMSKSIEINENYLKNN